MKLPSNSIYFVVFQFSGHYWKKIWNASRICVSSLRRGHANLLCIVPILVYVMPKQTQTVVGSICLINLWTFWKLEHVVLGKKISKNRKFFFSFLKGFRKSGKKNFWKILKNFRKFFEIFFWNFFRGWARTHGKCHSLMWFCKSGKKNFEKFFEKFSKIKFFFFTFEGDERVRRSPLSQIVRSSYPRLG